LKNLLYISIFEDFGNNSHENEDDFIVGAN